MNCPRCSGNLSSRDWAGIEVDMCSSCGGTWFDKGEFDSVKSGMDERELKELDAKPADNEFTRTEEGSLMCPKCKVVMDAFLYQYSSGIKLDRCNICDGFWFDCGEIGAALAYLEAQEKKDLSDEEITALLNRGRENARKEIEDKSLDGVVETGAVKGLYRLMNKVGKFVSKLNPDIVA